MCIKHVGIINKVAWNIRNYRYVGDVSTGLSFVLKRIGPLAAIISLVFYLLVLYLSAISKPPEHLSVSIYSESSIETAANTFCSSLGSTFLLIEDTTIHPLYLWVINVPSANLNPQVHEHVAPLQA